MFFERSFEGIIILVIDNKKKHLEVFSMWFRKYVYFYDLNF